MTPEVERRRRRRTSEEIDPRTGELVTPLKVKTRVENLEKRVRRDRIENRVLYTLVFLALVGAGYGIDRIQDLREQRVADQSESFQTICENERTVINRLIDTKRKQIAANTILGNLIVGVTDAPEPDPEGRRTRMALRTAARQLKQENLELEEGKTILRLELASLDCNLLAGTKPFRR